MVLAKRLPLPEPLPLDWPMKPVASACTTDAYLPDGRRELTIAHDLVRDVTPAMLEWWFTHIAGTMEIDGREWSRYRVWHPRDHIHWALDRPAADGAAGRGAAFRIVEAFGRDPACYVDSTDTVEKLDETGIRLVQRLGSLIVFSLEHWFEPVSEGTRYRSRMLVGTAAPILRRAINPAMRRWLFTTAMGPAWLKHNIEEVGNFEHFLPALYAEQIARAGGAPKAARVADAATIGGRR